jgi:hypothetical protein
MLILRGSTYQRLHVHVILAKCKRITCVHAHRAAAANTSVVRILHGRGVWIESQASHNTKKAICWRARWADSEVAWQLSQRAHLLKQHACARSWHY